MIMAKAKAFRDKVHDLGHSALFFKAIFDYNR